MHKKFFMLALLMSVVLVFFGGCTAVRGRGPVASRDYEVASFTEVSTGGSNTVIFRQSENYALTIEMHENLFEHITPHVQNGVLTIRFNNAVNVNHGNNSPRIYVYAPSLEGINLSGSVSTEDWDSINAENFSINASGSSKVDIPLEADSVNIRASGSARVNLTGNASSANVNASGSSRVDLAVSDSLNITASGSGRVTYTGSPVVSQSTSGSARVQSAN